MAPQATAETRALPKPATGAGDAFDWSLAVGLGICAFEAYTEDPNDDLNQKNSDKLGAGRKSQQLGSNQISEKLGIHRESGIPLITPSGTKVYFLDQ